MFILFVVACKALLSGTAIVRCDFETNCNDFTISSYWSITNGFNPLPIDHDHTLNNRSGHYIYYNPSSKPFRNSEIKTTDLIEPKSNRAACFRTWYYTPVGNLPFYIQLIQGDDEQLTRVVDTFPGKDPSSDEWTLVNVVLPNEKVKIFIRLIIVMNLSSRCISKFSTNVILSQTVQSILLLYQATHINGKFCEHVMSFKLLVKLPKSITRSIINQTTMHWWTMDEYSRRAVLDTFICKISWISHLKNLIVWNFNITIMAMLSAQI